MGAGLLNHQARSISSRGSGMPAAGRRSPLKSSASRNSVAEDLVAVRETDGRAAGLVVPSTEFYLGLCVCGRLNLAHPANGRWCERMAVEWFHQVTIRNSGLKSEVALRSAQSFPAEMKFTDPEAYREVVIDFPRPRRVHAISFATTGEDRQFDPVCWEVDGYAAWKRFNEKPRMAESELGTQ